MSARNTPYAGSARTPLMAGGVALALLLLTGGVVTVASNVLPVGNSAPGPVAALELPAPSPSPSKVFERLDDIPVPEKPTTMEEAPAVPVPDTEPGLIAGTESLSKEPVGFPPGMPPLPEGASTDPTPPEGAKPAPPTNSTPPGPPPTETSNEPAKPGQPLPPAPKPEPCPAGQTCKDGPPPDPNAPPPPPTDCPPNGLPCVEADRPVPSPTGPPPSPNPELGECASYDPMAPACDAPPIPKPSYEPIDFPVPDDLCEEPCDHINPPEPIFTGHPGGSFNPWDWALKVKACDGVTANQVGQIVNDTVTAHNVYDGQCNYAGKREYTEEGYTETFGAAIGYYGSGAKNLMTSGTAVAGLGDKAIYRSMAGSLGLTIWKGDYAVEVTVNAMGNQAARLDAAKKIGVTAIDWVVKTKPAIPPPPTAQTPYPGTQPTVTTSSSAGSQATTLNYMPSSNSTMLDPNSPLVALALMGMTTLALGGLLIGTKAGLFAKAAG